MGGYVSVPFTSKKVIHVEPCKPVVVSQEFEDIAQIMNPQVAPEQENGQKVAEVTEVAKVTEVKEAIQEEVTIVSFPPKMVRQLSIIIEEEERAKELSLNVPTVTSTTEELEAPELRIPEFTGNASSESHAVKKFNRRHRKK
jgi:hypothetical protein